MPRKIRTHESRLKRYRQYKPLVDSNKRYYIKRMSNPALAQAQKIYNSARWQRVRKMKLSRNPVCEDPYEYHELCGHPEPAIQVHHIVKLIVDIDKAFDMDNLMSLCTGCHARIERDEER